MKCFHFSIGKVRFMLHEHWSCLFDKSRDFNFPLINFTISNLEDFIMVDYPCGVEIEIALLGVGIVVDFEDSGCQ